MSTLQDVYFSNINITLESASLFINAAEMHGILSGIACGGGDLKGHAWRPDFNCIVNEGEALPVAVKKIVDVLFTTIVKECNGNSLNFRLLLPDDDLPIVERVEAVSHWAQGFLAGFGLVQQELSNVNMGIQELIRDIRDVSQLALDIEGEDEESEMAYVDIVEYLRIGGMFCFDYFSSHKISTVSKKSH